MSATPPAPAATRPRPGSRRRPRRAHSWPLAAAPAVAVLLTAAALAGCSGGGHREPVAVTRTPGATVPAGALADLTSLDPAASWFAAHAGQPRLLLALSPT
jgi:hypothetical protein